ncbi:MAG: hypothetical protein JNK64_25470 [Myxococcales bacterium]|nr:hypothetical protein [Myxococcales bacterium]
MIAGDAIARACGDVPGLLRAALVLLPEAFFLAGHGEARASDYEPLVRAAARCLTPRATPRGDVAPAPFVEYVLVLAHGVIVIEASRQSSRLALVLECDHSANLTLIQLSCRAALAALEATLGRELETWGMAS